MAVVRTAPELEGLDLELVVPVRSLVFVAVMIRDGEKDEAFEHVKQLISRSRSLDDVNGKKAVVARTQPKPQLKRNAVEELREQMLAFLREQGESVTTTAVRKQFPQMSQSAVLNALKKLRAEGLIESRSFGHGSAIEWRAK